MFLCIHTHTHISPQSSTYTGYTGSATAVTGASMGCYTSSSMEKSSDYDEDDDEQLVLPDFDPSQAYLSLGLTPLSQLSPDTNASSEFGFFPSMPPPVAPSNSLFSASSSGTSLTMDNPFSIHSSGQSSGSIIDSSMMPDAYPERRRRSKHENTLPLSQGFPLKLEPVLEQSPPFTGSELSGKQNGFTSTDESSEESPSPSRDTDQFMFPSAVATPEFSRLSQGRTAMRKRPAKSGSRENLHVTSPQKGPSGGYGSLGVSTRETRRQTLSPSQEAKKKRQQAREVEIARQKEELKKKLEWEESERRRQQELRMARIAKEYGHSRDPTNLHYLPASTVNALNPHEMTNGHGDANAVLREAARFEAMQMTTQTKGPQHSRQASSSVSSSGSQDSSPRKWTPRHSRHSSLDETPSGSGYRAERSDSMHRYTIFEHRTHM